MVRQHHQFSLCRPTIKIPYHRYSTIIPVGQKRSVLAIQKLAVRLLSLMIVVFVHQFQIGKKLTNIGNLCYGKQNMQFSSKVQDWALLPLRGYFGPQTLAMCGKHVKFPLQVKAALRIVFCLLNDLSLYSEGPK